MVRVPWNETGSLHALNDLWRQSALWKHDWALVQYTALMWSRRGFPVLFLAVLCVLRVRGVRTAVVFHDPQAFGGSRFVDRVRRACQRAVMHWTYRLSHASIVTIPLEQITWLPSRRPKAAFIHICATLPSCARSARSEPGTPKPLPYLQLQIRGTTARKSQTLPWPPNGPQKVGREFGW